MTHMEFGGGLPETICGRGSTVAFTEKMRPQLSTLLHLLDVRAMLDAPCGDFNWMRLVDLHSIDYIGMDSNPDHCANTLTKISSAGLSPKSKEVFCRNVILDPLGDAAHVDLILCRDFMQHLPDELIWFLLRNFLRTSAKFFLFTSHGNENNSKIGRAGDFRPLNLTKAPFYFSEPKEKIEDGTNRILGLWTRYQIEIHCDDK